MAREGYIELSIPADADPDALRERFITSIQDAIPGWEPADGDIVVRVGDGTAEMAADREAMVIDVSRELFRTIGGELFGVLAVEEAAATATITWAVSPASTVLAGTQVTIDGVGFEVTEDTAIATSGPVPVAALAAGSAGTGLSGTVEVLDAEALAFTTSVALVAPTTGGRDAEAPDDYEDRLSARIAHLGRPVLPADFEDRARDISTVYRALAIDLYKPVDMPTPGDPVDVAAERTVTVVPVTEDGSDVSSGTKTELDAYLQAEREVDFEVYVTDPTRTTINVTAAVTVWDGYTPADVADGAEAAVSAFLDAATWGAPPRGEVPQWNDTPIVDAGALEAAILAVDGVRRVVDLAVYLWSDSFTASDALDSYTVSPGGGTIAVSGGALVPSSTAEKRILVNGVSAPIPRLVLTECRAVLEYLTGTDLTTNVGVLLRAKDSLNAVSARVNGTGVSATLEIRKLVAGAFTTLATVALAAPLSAATGYWVVGWTDGDTIHAEHWLSDPALGGEPAMTLAHTLTGGDATAAGEGVAGTVGIRVVPGDTNWRYRSLYVDSPTGDVLMVGPAPLPVAGTITVSA